jgi:Na+-driven multidrug efflux pump
MIVQSLYAIIDRAFIGNSAGTLAIAGITVCIPLMTIFMALGMLIGMGGASLLSIRLGQEKHDEARRVLGNTFLLLILSSVPLCAITGLLLTPMLRLFGASTGSLPYAAAYMSLILVGIPFQMVGFGMNNFIRAIGRPGLAMTTMLIGALLNAALAPLFIFVLSWGIRGAAFATIIAQAVSCLFVMAFFSAPYGPFRIRRSDLALRAPVVRGIVSIGLAPRSSCR